MGQIAISVGGRSYTVNCRDGEESHLVKLGQLLDDRAEQARRAVGGVNEPRELLLAGLLLADEYHGLVNAPAPIAEDLSPELEAIAERIERIADALEARAGSD